MAGSRSGMARVGAAALLGLASVTNASAAPRLGGCDVFPGDSVFNTRIDRLPVHPQSKQWVASIGRDTTLHPDFGSGTWNGNPIGIPLNIVSATQSTSAVTFQYDDQSDIGPYPIPASPKIEGPTDSHLLMIQRQSCMLYELFAAKKTLAGSWRAGSGAIWNLNSHGLRPDTWTSADAAGLPILPLLVRYDDVARGALKHAVRFTAEPTRGSYLWPARHEASDVTDPNVPPLGARFRLKRGYDISGFSPNVQVILLGLKRYGMILSDNGSNWYITGAADERWDNDELHELKSIPGRAFEAVDESGLMINEDSGQALQP